MHIYSPLAIVFVESIHGGVWLYGVAAKDSAATAVKGVGIVRSPMAPWVDGELMNSLPVLLWRKGRSRSHRWNE
jgi:hypothetical protein